MKRAGSTSRHHRLHVLRQDRGAAAPAAPRVRSAADPCCWFGRRSTRARRQRSPSRAPARALRARPSPRPMTFTLPSPRRRARSSPSTRRRCSTRAWPTIADRLAVEGYEVIVSGLDTDFAGRPFGAMPTLLALADSVAKLTAICTFPGLRPGGDAHAAAGQQPARRDRRSVDRHRRHGGPARAGSLRGALPDASSRGAGARTAVASGGLDRRPHADRPGSGPATAIDCASASTASRLCTEQWPPQSDRPPSRSLDATRP